MSLRVLFLTIGNERKPSTYYRVLQYLPYLKQRGVWPSVMRVGGLTHRRRKEILLAVKHHDVVHIQKRLFSPFLLLVLKRLNPYLIYDYDDALFAEPPGHDDARARRRLQRHRRRLRWMFRFARTIIAGNRFLSDYAQPLARQVIVLPTPPPPFGRSLELSKGPSSSSRLGWLGTSGNLPMLDPIRPVLKRVLMRYAHISLHILCNQPPDWGDDPPFTFTRWCRELEEAWLGAIDIGLMPVPDDDWGRGKCAFKLLRYMSAGKAAVASDVGMNREVIRSGENGYLASNPSDWESHLVQLIESPAHRYTFGVRARKTVESNYALNEYAARFYDILESCLPS